MRVSEVMSRDVQVARPNQTICDTARMMRDMDVGALPVGEDGRPVGMITDSDIAVRGVAEDKPPSTHVRDVMTQDVKFCYDDEDADHVARNMGDQQVRRLPMVNRDNGWSASWCWKASPSPAAAIRRPRPSLPCA